jgi:tRNA(His) 5'-end guanylyltransferase
MVDLLGDRMKSYEDRFRHYLPRRSYTLLRLDGKAFHTYTRGFDKPFDVDLINSMDNTAKFLCEKIQGSKIAFVQSDEITILLEDFKTIQTDAYFDGNIQKIASISASMATAFFNKNMAEISENKTQSLAFFDCRCWSISDPYEVENTFIWRQKDAIRNSIQLVAQSMFSHKELFKKSQKTLIDMISNTPKPWENYPQGLKYGRVIIKKHYNLETQKPSGERVDVLRSGWFVEESLEFTKNREFLRSYIGSIPSWKDQN